MPDKEKRGNPLFANTAASTGQRKAPAGNPVPPEVQQLAEEQEENKSLPSSQVRHREVRDIPFEEAYKRETVYFDRELKRRFDRLLRNKRKSKTELINEALSDLLEKYEAT